MPEFYSENFQWSFRSNKSVFRNLKSQKWMAYKQLCSLFSSTSTAFTQKNSQEFQTLEVRERGKEDFLLVEVDLIS